MLRVVLGVVLGLLIGVVCIAVLETAGHWLHPPPDGLDLTDREALAAHISDAPITALLLVLAAYAAGSLAGGFVSGFVGGQGWRGACLIVGVVLMCFGTLNLVMIPHPIWFVVAALLCFLPLAFLGGWVANRLRAAPSIPS